MTGVQTCALPISGVLDEPATERALVAYLARGVRCGALDPDEGAGAI